MVRPVLSLVTATLAIAAVLSGCASGSSPAEARPARLAVEAYVEPGGDATARVTDAAHRSTTIGIDGVTIAEDGASLNPVPSGVSALARRASTGGATPELLVSNYSDVLGDFSPEIGTALLGSAAHRKRVATDLAALAATQHTSGVQIDLESLREDDRAGLVAFAAEVRTAVHDRLGKRAPVSMAVMASTDAAGYRDTGYDLRALTANVDRFVLMTYDEHGPWSDPGTIGSLPWTKRVIAAAEGQGLPASRIDLGIAGYGYVWGGHGDAQLTPTAAQKAAGAAARWSAPSGEWWAKLADGRELHWSDARSYRERVALARTLGLHGVALWSLNLMPLPA
ncbi:glycosyl hydrolase family 18 protein [Curtobacterium sp. ISL-83]|uniref:glycosyl hydrolase family 18 protein n=1 Tax=Curtobacterium sp. ISL-83 TaxID=2819145 RepID=UPI001BE65888|nr:glycosyl hydrolase family 18 protein [Curtobacterium sp. ISL-83]MBT2503659.1 hydrolase [Curtobacterium sp. ISL-83]